MRKSKNSTKKTWTDPDDAPALDRAWFKKADVFDGKKLVRRGRPRKAVKAKPVTIRLDPVVEEYFRAAGRGWQTRINKVLRKLVEEGRV